jgi:hypothetical protein
MLYNYFRDYDPQTGRYAESDPAGLSAGTNTYGYVRQNPIGRMDPLGLYDVIVAIWASNPLGGNPVGHVVLADTNGHVITSEFPAKTNLIGTLTPLDWGLTIQREGGQPDYVYSVHLPNSAQEPIWQASQAENNKYLWSSVVVPGTTNCVQAAINTLGVGQIPGFPYFFRPFTTPDSFNETMYQLSNYPRSGVTRLPNVPW